MTTSQGILITVITPTEAANLWGKQRKSIMGAIYSGRLIARQSPFGGTWLIETSSGVKLWGKGDKAVWGQIIDSSEVAGVGLK